MVELESGGGGADLSVGGGHGELHVAVGDVRLAVVEAAAAEEALAHGGESSVAANNQVGLDLPHGAVRPEERTEVRPLLDDPGSVDTDPPPGPLKAELCPQPGPEPGGEAPAICCPTTLTRLS